MAKAFPPHYKKAIAKANDLLADGAKRAMAICEEIHDPKKDQVYTLQVGADITIVVTKKPPFKEDKKKHGI